MATKAEKYQAQVRAGKFKKVPHSFTGRVFHWRYCTGCGLVTLKNDSTERRMRQPCESMED